MGHKKTNRMADLNTNILAIILKVKAPPPSFLNNEFLAPKTSDKTKQGKLLVGGEDSGDSSRVQHGLSKLLVVTEGLFEQ